MLNTWPHRLLTLLIGKKRPDHGGMMKVSGPMGSPGRSQAIESPLSEELTGSS